MSDQQPDVIGGLLSEKRRYLKMAAMREVIEFCAAGDDTLIDEAVSLGLDAKEVVQAMDSVADEIRTKLFRMREAILDGDPLA
jgi:hypothetical protein